MQVKRNTGQMTPMSIQKAHTYTYPLVRSQPVQPSARRHDATAQGLDSKYDNRELRTREPHVEPQR